LINGKEDQMFFLHLSATAIVVRHKDRPRALWRRVGAGLGVLLELRRGDGEFA
jgi:hypothetical protein